MEFKIFKYRAKNNHFQLHAYSMCAWMLEEDWDIFLNDYPAYRQGKDDFFIKIECHNPAEFTDFVIYSKLAALPKDHTYEREGSRLIWLPQEIMPERDCTTNKRSVVEVSIVKPNEIPTSDVVTIKLKEDDVDRWSDRDFDSAVRHLRNEMKLFCTQQRFFFNLNSATL